MADNAYAQTLSVRQNVIDLAREQVGCHYVWGGAGNTPDQDNGAHYRTHAVKMHYDDPSRGRPGHEPARSKPILFAAWCRVDGDKVCAGRASQPDAQGLPDGSLLLATPDDPSAYKWPRPEGVLTAATAVYGECCIGIRHFDCIGYINWLISEEVKPIHHGIGSIINATRDVGFSAVEAGDILTIGTHHIGIASGTGTVLHAKGTAWGVIESTGYGGWTRCGRPAAGFWM